MLNPLQQRQQPQELELTRDTLRQAWLHKSEREEWSGRGEPTRLEQLHGAYRRTKVSPLTHAAEAEAIHTLN